MTGEDWRKAREAKGLALRHVARAAGISAPFLSDVEHGRRSFSPEVEKRVRVALGIEPPPPDHVGWCVVCKGSLERRKWKEYLGDPMHMILGPGHQNQLTGRSEIFCPRCGLKYLRAPKEEP